MKKFYPVIVLLVMLIASQSCQFFKPKADEELELLTNWMIGSFDSKFQSEVDTNFFNIHLEMVRIWDERDDAVWLYVEQAASWALERPYRQRVYRVSRIDDESFESAVFTFANPLRFAGKYNDDNPLGHLVADSLVEKKGCSIVLKYEDGAFVGSTIGQGCESKLRGASYASSKVRIEEFMLTSWDQGFDENGEQVWGAVTGPYEFRKK